MKQLKLGRSLTAVLLISAILPAAALAARELHTDRAASRPSAQVSITSVKVTGSTILIKGNVHLTPNTAAERRKTGVALTLRSTNGSAERLVKVNSADRFSESWHTTYTGELTLSAVAEIAGARTGDLVKRAVAVVGSVTSGGPVKLLGTFDLTAGSNPKGEAPSGTYFEMLTHDGDPVVNVSAGDNTEYTPLRPGTDGGLSTVDFQPSKGFNAHTGGALASQIIEPTGFEGDNFTVDTNSTDVQTGTANPLPVIYDLNGKLSGQITAWDAQWNRQNFNQGSPKPGGSLPGRTTVLSGTYNSTTGAFTLTWKSLIVGGPFNGFTGAWHLTGHFVPAG
jgi:hypothetical protein